MSNGSRRLVGRAAAQVPVLTPKIWCSHALCLARAAGWPHEMCTVGAKRVERKGTYARARASVGRGRGGASRCGLLRGPGGRDERTQRRPAGAHMHSAETPQQRESAVARNTFYLLICVPLAYFA